MVSTRPQCYHIFFTAFVLCLQSSTILRFSLCVYKSFWKTVLCLLKEICTRNVQQSMTFSKTQVLHGRTFVLLFTFYYWTGHWQLIIPVLQVNQIVTRFPHLFGYALFYIFLPVAQLSTFYQYRHGLYFCLPQCLGRRQLHWQKSKLNLKFPTHKEQIHLA